MATGSFETGKSGNLRHLSDGIIKLGLINANSEKLTDGTEVFISANATANKRAAANFPIGIVIDGAVQNEKMLVATHFDAVVYVDASAAIVAGAFVSPTGNVDLTTNRNEYVTSTAGDFANAIAIESASAAGDKIAIGILKASIVAP